MAKVLLVEDDKSLREIYGVRLLAEGYDIVSAGNGEEAVAMAVRELPDLIIADVMMPKMSGFDMLDLLRSNEATKNIKVIMMTALGSDTQRERGAALGADRYLVKSQVGIEDMVATVHEVLDDKDMQTDAAVIQPGQSPINPMASTMPSVAAGVPAPTLPPVPTSVSTVTSPAATTTPAAPDESWQNPQAQSDQESATPLPSITPLNGPLAQSMPYQQNGDNNAAQTDSNQNSQPATDANNAESPQSTAPSVAFSSASDPMNMNPNLDINNLAAETPSVNPVFPKNE